MPICPRAPAGGATGAPRGARSVPPPIPKDYELAEEVGELAKRADEFAKLSQQTLVEEAPISPPMRGTVQPV